MESGKESEQFPSLKSFLQLKKKYDSVPLDELPKSYRSNSDKEKLYIWSASNFQKQIRQFHPRFDPLCLVGKNECGVEKLIITYIKPTVLPFAHLFNVDSCAKFVSDFIFYTVTPL